MPHAGTRCAEEHADQVVVAAAAAEAAGEIGTVDLEDRAGVIGQPAGQASDPRARARRPDAPAVRAHDSRELGERAGRARGRRRATVAQRSASTRASSVGGRCAVRRTGPAARAAASRRCPRASSSRDHRRRGRSCRACPRATSAVPCSVAGTPAASSMPARSWRWLSRIAKSAKPSPASTSAAAVSSSASTSHRRRADRIDVALVELAEAALLRPVGPPHRLDLIALEEPRQLRAVLGDDPRQRHRQVVAQRQVRLAASCRPRRA